jgi:hypothetical protein
LPTAEERPGGTGLGLLPRAAHRRSDKFRHASKFFHASRNRTGLRRLILISIY